MAYVSSIQTITDANGMAHAFLENDGLLWQCQWNAEAERWDKARVVPGTYGGEKLQALLVDDLWPTSGKVGNKAGNTPGIVLAYRMGTGEAAQVYATLGRWGSDGQLSWNEPLLLSDSGTVTEAIRLRASGDGGFELVSQRREPVAADPGNTLQTVLGARSDSELIKQSFSVSGSDATGYQLTNKTASNQTPQDVTSTKEPVPVAPASATAGSTQFSRTDLLLAPAPAAALKAASLLGVSSEMPGSPGGSGGWSGGIALRFGNPKGQNTGVVGLALGQTRARWQLQIPNSSPQSDWRPTKSNLALLNESVFKEYNQALSWGKASRKQTLGLVGSFGWYGYGTQVSRNDIGITLIVERKTEKGELQKSLEYAISGLNGAIFSQSRWYFTALASFQTKYYFDNLNIFRPSAINLEKVKNTFSATLGVEYQRRSRLETGGYFQWSAGLSFGYSGQYTQKPHDNDGALPEDLKWIGYAAGVSGPILGLLAQGQSFKSGFSNVINLNVKRKDFFGNGFSKSFLRNDSDVNNSPYVGYQAVQLAQALLGTAFAVAPPITGAISDTIDRSEYQNGLVVRAQAGLRYLYKSIAGFYGNLRTGFYDYPNQNAFSGSPWQAKIQLDGGLALPFGVSVPILAYQVTFPNPLKASAPKALSAANTTGNSSIDSYIYLPASGSTLLPSIGSSSDGETPLAGGASELQLFCLAGTSKGEIVPPPSTSALVLINAGSGLKNGDWANVPVLGELLPGSRAATVNFTVVDGKIVADSIEINAPATGDARYLLLPQTSSSSGAYALIPDVFSADILPSPSDGSKQTFGDLLSQLPVITARTNVKINNPFSISSILAVPQVVPVDNGPVSGSSIYPNPTPSDNSLQTYSGVAVCLSGSGVTSLNQTTATVSLSNGTIVRAVLDDPLYLSSSSATVSGLTLTVDLLSDQGFIADYNRTGAVTTNPVYSVTAQSQGYSNVVEDQSYRANPGYPANSDQPTKAVQSAVWLADGINDQWQQTPSQAGWPVFNRVVFRADDGQITFLNSSTTSSTNAVIQTVTTPDEVSLETLYNDLTDPKKFGAVPSFSAASSPTVITLSDEANPDGTKGLFAGSTAVFWVEASDQVIPETAKSDGNTNYYQDYLNALYGNQRINYRILDDGTWKAPTTAFLSSPGNAVIRNLKAFNVEIDGLVRTLLVWDETSIATIKGTPPDPITIKGWIDANSLTLAGASSGLEIGDLISGDGVKQGTLITGIITPFDPLTGRAEYKLNASQTIGSSSQPAGLNATPLLPPTVIKAGFINPNASSIQWSDLFSDGSNSTITTIPWDQTNDIGVGIESLSVASKQVVDASGQVRDTAVLSWSEDVRTPYVESVLNDQPLIYLQFADLQPGFNAINIGSTASGTTTGTSASSTGLNFVIASALSKSSASAVQNMDGTGVIATGTGSQNTLYNSLFNGTPINQRSSSPFSQLTGSVAGTILTVTALSGALAEGDLLTGPGLAPDTKIKEVLSGFDPATGTGSYTINQSQANFTSGNLEAVPNPAPSSSKELGLPYSSFTGSINGTTLTVSQLNGSLAVGDPIFGEGVRLGTTINGVLSFDQATGAGQYQLSADPLQQGTVLAPSALIATTSSSVPYTIEFWTKLLPGSNANQGAGLVAFGQPSEQAIGAAIPPSGWLMTAVFTVERLTYQQAAAQGFQEAYDKLTAQIVQPGDLFAWGWSLDATGTNTTALGGSGGSNLYSNALSLTNLYSGQTLAGVDAFLNSYQLKAADLVGGDGLFANTIDLVPDTSLDFNNSLDPQTGQPVSNLNAVSIDMASSLLNNGLVVANQDGQLSSDPIKDQNLKAMFQSLWDYQESYASAKVAFTLAPSNTSTTSTSGFEQYGGLPLEFAISPGPAISVNSAGNLVFDVADGVSITSSATSPSNKRQSPLPADLRDGEWHYVVASYLPDYRSYTINGVETQVPTNNGTASLYVDNQLVASQGNVTNAHLATNINDIALLLPNNVGGAIDQFALYNKALLQAPALQANSSGAWPEPSKQDALAILKQLGYPATADTANPGAIESAITDHWLSRDVNPDNALLATYSSSFTPSSSIALSGSWSEAVPLNPIPQPLATTPSATAPSLVQDLVIAITPKDWSSNIWTNTNGTTSQQFNPGGDKLQKITVTLTPDQGGDQLIRVLSPGQILMGQATTLAALQPRATSTNLDYTFLSNTPDLNLLISRKPGNSADSGDLNKSKTYTAEIRISVYDPNASTGTFQDYTATIVGFNTNGSQIFNAYGGTASGASAETLINKRTTALATAAVLEAAPLQLKYIDSGILLKSASSQLAANSPATPSPAPSFGQSQAYGWFPTSTVNRFSGWLAIAQTNSANATSDPAGRVWIQYTGDFTSDAPQTKIHTAVSDTAKAPSTWLNALASSNFSPETPNRPLLYDKSHQASYGGLLVQADPTAGWGQNFGQTMLVVDVNGDGTNDLVLSAPSANGGGKVVIIDGTWIQTSLTNASGSTTLNLANPENLGPYVTVLSPAMASGTNEDSSQSAFGWALAFDSVSKTLYIGAPNYSRKVGPDLELVPIGAVYQYKSPSTTFASGSQSLPNPTLGIAGRTDTNDVSGPASSYWGANLGASLAVSKESSGGVPGEGKLAIGAPGVQASLLYSGTEAVNQLVAGEKTPSTPYGQGALVKVMLPTPVSTDGLDVYVSSSDGTSNTALVDVISNNPNPKEKKGVLANEESTYMQALKELQTRPIAKASADNNSAIQTAAVGSVYLLNTAIGLTPGTLNPSKASATFYGPNAWNTGGASDFGASIAFGDSTNTNSQNILSVGSPSTGGPGAVYLINTSQPFDSPSSSNAPSWIKNTNLGTGSLGLNQYLAYLTSGLTLYGAEDLDQFGSGLVNLGDTNGDGYEDLLVQAPNASSGAGNGYVVFGNDQLIQNLKSNSGINSYGVTLLGGHNPAVGSVKPGSIGQLTFADDTSLTTPILSELGHGISAATGQGSFGAGDVDANGNNDIPLGSGINGQAYLTYGHDYLESIGSLQLQKLASSTGYLLGGLAAKTQGSLRSIGDFNDDGYGDYFSIQPGNVLDTVRIELGANTQDVLASYAYNYYTFQVASGTEVIPVGDVNGDGYSDIALFLQQNLSSPTEGNGGAGSTTGFLYGRPSTMLPVGAGFGYIAPVSDATNGGLTGKTDSPLPTNSPLTTLPGVNPDGALSDASPGFLSVGNTIYSVIKERDGNTIYFNYSGDGGNTWNGWTNLSLVNSSFKSWNSPSLAWFEDKLYLAFLNTENQLTLAYWDPNSGLSTKWSNPTTVGDGNTVFTSRFSPQLLSDSYRLLVSWVGLDGTDVGNGTLASSISTNPDALTPLWSPQQQLLERSSGNSSVFQPIVATAAPSATLIKDVPVLAVNNAGTVNVYAGAGGSSFTLNSSFSPGNSNDAGITAVGITTTDTGLALSYRNTDGSVSLQRLNFLKLDGTAVNGVVINPDGSINTDQANLQWEGISLDSSSGVSTALATSLLTVNGTLQLGSISNSTSEQYKVQLHALPALSNPASVTWLNTTVQLPDGQGGWLAQQKADLSTSSTLTAAGDITGDGLNDMLITTNNVVLAASPLLKTGVRLIRGASTSIALLDANQADASTQTLQLAAALPTNSSAASTSLTGGASVGRLPQLTISGQSSSLITNITSESDQTFASFTATASNPNSLTKFFETAAQSQQALGPASGQGQLALNTSGSYGDLNGDGRLDFLAADTPTTLYGINQQSWALWSIRAAGDVNGNGVDDVLLSLAPQGPAYVPTSAGSPTALQSVLVDGSLFKVDKANNSFWLDQLRTPLNPNNRSQLYDVASTSSSDYLPSLQNWFEPILNFKPGSLTAASTANPFNPAGARSFLEPAVAISPEGGAYLVFSGAEQSGPSGASGLWIAFQQAGSWKQIPLPVGTDADYHTPSATFYQGKFYIAYSDILHNLHIAFCEDSPENTSSTNWHSYQVKTTAPNESTSSSPEYTSSSPTLVAEAGRLALYFPSSDYPSVLRYLYSNDPDNSGSSSNAYGNWGGSPDTTSGGYSGGSGKTGYKVSGPIAATTFHGSTVLAFRGIPDSGAVSLEDIFLLTQDSRDPTAANPSPLLNWKLTDTGISNVNGVALTSDQSLLYLTSSSSYGSSSPSSFVLSLRPNTDGSWSSDPQQTLGGNPSIANGIYDLHTPLATTIGYSYGVVNPFLSGGQLMAAWTDSSYKIQVADLDATITSPSQQSLAGYSIDGNIDINGDGFKDVLISDPSDPSKSVNNQYALFGGDYLNIASQVGTPGDDVMIGTPLADVIYTLQGADQVKSNGGKDVIYTGAGDDSISINDYAFIRIDAGAGFNSLQLEGNVDQSYNFVGTGLDAPLWAPVSNGGSSNQSPAMVRDGNTIYMARCGLDSYLYWTQSTDGGQSWADWQQLPAVITSNNTPSLAIAGGDLYLAYVGQNQSVYITQYDGYSHRWNDDPVNLYQDIQYSPPTATKVKNGSGQLAAIAETVNGAEGLAIYYVDATSSNIFRQYNNGYGGGFVDLYNPYYWETADLDFTSSGPLAVTEFDGSTYMAQMDNQWLYTSIYSPGGNDPAISSNWNYITLKNIGNSSGISLSSIPKAVGEASSGLLLNTTDIASNQQVTYLLADAIPGSTFKPFNSRPFGSATANQQTASILSIPAKANSQSVLLEAVADASRADTVSVSIYNSINPDPGIFCGTQLKNIQLINSIDYGANTLVFNAAAVNTINPDRVLFLTPDAHDFIGLSDEFSRNQSFDMSSGGSLWYTYTAGPAVSSTSNPTLVYVRVPQGNIASTWLSSQVSVGSPVFGVQTPALIATTRAAGESESVASNPVPAESFSSPDAVSLSPSLVAGNTIFGDGLTITAYRTTPGSGVARFRIGRTDVSRSQIVSYVSSTRNSSAEPGSHYTPVAGLVRLEVGQAQADIAVPIDADAIAALRKATVSLEVAELIDRGQKEINLLLDAVPSPTGERPVLSGLNLEVDSSGTLSSIGFRSDTNKGAASVGLASTFNLNVLRRKSADSSASNSNNRTQKLVLSEGALTKFDRDGVNNGQVELQFDLNSTTGSILLQPAIQVMKPLVLSKLDPSKQSATLGLDLTTTSLDALSLAPLPKGVVLNETAVDFTVEADADGKAKVFLDLTQVGDDLEITHIIDGVMTRKANHQWLYYGIEADGSLSALTYNARRKTGARFYDANGDGIADLVNLVFADGGMGDTGPSGDGLIHEPSVGGVSNLTDVECIAIDSRTLQAASRTNKDAPAALVVKAKLDSRSTSANQICYVVHDPSDSLSFDSIFADLDLLKARSQTLYTSLESTDVTLASGTSLSREILLTNGQYVRFFEVVDGNLNQLSSANDSRLRLLSTGGFSKDLRSVNAFSRSGVSLSLALVDGDQGLNALIGQEQGLAAVLDFTSFTTDQKVEGSFSLSREAAFDAVTGFYRTLDIKGTVWLDPSDHSKGTIAPGQAGTTAADYGAAALRNMVDLLTGMSVGNRQTSSSWITLQESTYLAPIAQVKGHTFVSFDKGNTDGISHFVTLATNTFGLEDLHGGGDNDFDDQVISFVFSKVVNPVV